jgi:hypothetical protein
MRGQAKDTADFDLIVDIISLFRLCMGRQHYTQGILRLVRNHSVQTSSLTLEVLVA